MVRADVFLWVLLRFWLPERKQQFQVFLWRQILCSSKNKNKKGAVPKGRAPYMIDWSFLFSEERIGLLSKLSSDEDAKLSRVKTEFFETLRHDLFPAGSYAAEKRKNFSAPLFSESKKELPFIFRARHPLVNFDKVTAETHLKSTLKP